MHIIRRALVIVAVILTAGVVLPAEAIPSNTRIDRVFRLPCAEDVCSTERDTKLALSSVVTGGVQLHVSSSSSLGLDWARIDARRDEGQWFCIKQWELNQNNFAGVFDWNTNEWPGDCPSGLQQPTRNGTYDLRLVAKEKVSGEQAVSSMFTLKVNNRPRPPQWSGDLSVAGAQAREPLVTLSFEANPEPDVLEYHYIRLAPNGSEGEWVVSATKPGGQGCDREGSTYICYDDDFPTHGFGGSYTYALVAYRSSPSNADSCALPPQSGCVQSSMSETRSITIDEPAVPTPNSGPTSGAGGGTRSGSSGSGTSVRSGDISRDPTTGRPRDNYCWTCGTYDRTLPFGEQPYEVARGGTSSADVSLASGLPEDIPVDRTQLWRSVAAGLLLLLAAGHAARALRRA